MDCVDGAGAREKAGCSETELSRLPIELIEKIFDETPGVLFFAKDMELRYVAANKAQRLLCGVRSHDALRGRSARDFFPEAYRSRYEARDQEVIRARRPSVTRLGQAASRRGRAHWLLCKHWPILGETGAPIGAAGISWLIESSARSDRICQRVASATEHMHAKFHQPLALEELAAAANISRSQLERDFVTLFGVPPQAHLNRIRICAARNLLHGDSAIANIALACGYSDQSGFARRFRAEVGLSPGAYRRHVRGERAFA